MTKFRLTNTNSCLITKLRSHQLSTNCQSILSLFSIALNPSDKIIPLSKLNLIFTFLIIGIPPFQVSDADIVKYFDSIEHHLLLAELRQYIEHSGILCLIKAWISSGIVIDEEVKLPEKGIPQGAVISPLLANVYLDKFDRAISNTDYYSYP